MTKMTNNLRAGALWALLLALGTGGARAGVDPSLWTLSPDQGTVAFQNSDTSLLITGPTGNFGNSYDAATITAPSTLTGGQYVYVDFGWDFNAGGSVGSIASLSYPGDGGSAVVFASGADGTTESGSYSFTLTAGESATFLLDSGETSAGKSPSTFSLEPLSVVPEMPTGPWVAVVLLGPVLGSWLVKRWRAKTSA